MAFAFLAIAVALFAATHLIPALPGLKARLQARFGAKYGMFFGLVATVLVIAIILAWRATPFVAVYEPPQWGRHAALALVLVAFVFLGVFVFRGRLRQWVRYPFAIALLFWGSAHLLANGDTASLILFGGLAIYAVVFIVLSLMAKVRPSEDVREGHDVLAIVIGVAFYAAMVQLHAIVIGVPIVTIQNAFGG